MSESSFREKIVKCIDKIRGWILYHKLYRPLEREKDPQKRFEKKLWMEIKGSFLSGMDSAMSWVKYKSYYYDNLRSEDEKRQVRSVLLSMLKSKEYDISKKAIIAYVCADLSIKDALQDIDALLQRDQDDSHKKIYRLAHEALTRGLTMKELVDEKFYAGEKV